MQSNNFVEGVSGWRMSRGLIEMYGGPAPIILGSLGEPEPEQPKPFIVVDGVTYINATCIKDASVEPKISVHYTIKPQVLNGKLVFAGFHIDDCDTRPEYEKARDAGAMDEYFAKLIGETQLFSGLKKRIEALEKGKDRLIADAKRGVADSILRDLEADRCSATPDHCKARFGASAIPFGGFSGVPLKDEPLKDAIRSGDDGALAEALDQWANKKSQSKVLESANGKLKINFSTGEFRFRP